MARDYSEQQKPDIVVNPKNGQPWASEDEVVAAIKSGEYGDPKFLKAANAQGGGWCIVKLKTVIENATGKTGPVAPVQRKQQKYFEVEFFPPSSPEEPQQLSLGVDGWVIVVTRGQRVMLPENHLRVADSAKHKVFKIQPGADRQVVGEVHRAMHRVLREVPRDEFMAALKAGNLTRDNDLSQQQAARAAAGVS